MGMKLTINSIYLFIIALSASHGYSVAVCYYFALAATAEGAALVLYSYGLKAVLEIQGVSFGSWSVLCQALRFTEV